MKIHTAGGNSIEIKTEGLMAVLTIGWATGMPTRSVEMTLTETETVANGLVDAIMVIEKRNQPENG